MKNFILWMIRTRLGIEKYRGFQFVNQKSRSSVFYFGDDGLMENYFGLHRPADISLNYILNCKIKFLEESDYQAS